MSEGRGFFERRADDAIQGAAEALFPENGLGAPSWRETELVPRTASYLALLPPPQRRMITALFVLLELALPLLVLRVGRYSRLPPSARADLVRRLRASAVYPVRLLGDSVKAVMTMMYMSHPQVMRHIGQYAACEAHAGDDVDVRLDALVAKRKVA